MKKQLKISTIVISSVVAALAITVLVLCLIVVRPLADLTTGYKDVNFIYSGTSATPGIASDERAKKLMDEGLKSSGFNVIQSIFEGKAGYAPKFKTEKDENGDKQRVKVFGKELTTLLKADNANTYVLDIDFGQVKELTVEKETIKYDRIKLEVYNTKGEIHDIAVYPYLFDMTVGVSDEVEDYQVSPLRIRANLSPLFNALNEIKLHFNLK